MQHKNKLFKVLTAIVLCVLACSLCACTMISGGIKGDSAFDVAVKNGFRGTEKQWLESLKGADGADGKNSADVTIEDCYQAAQKNGYSGTFLQFLKEYLSFDNAEDTQYSTADAILSVVCVICEFTTSSGSSYYGGGTQTQASAGSGVIYKINKEAGSAYIITNYHVVYNARSTTSNKISDKINVYLYGAQYKEFGISATYIGGSLTHDIAVIKVSDSDAIKNGDAKAATISYDGVFAGQTVVAIGNPEGSGISATKGVVSVDSETISMKGADNVTDVDFRVIRTDAGVNEGNSGGGLFDKDGKLVGIVNAKVIKSDVEAIGYAIPVNVATTIADKAIANGNNITKCVLGVATTIKESKAWLNPSTGLTEIKETIKVVEVSKNSLSEGKLQVDDVILSVSKGGKTLVIDRNYKLRDFVLGCNVGDEITITISRNGAQLQVTVLFDAANVADIM